MNICACIHQIQRIVACFPCAVIKLCQKATWASKEFIKRSQGRRSVNEPRKGELKKRPWRNMAYQRDSILIEPRPTDQGWQGLIN